MTWAADTRTDDWGLQHGTDINSFSREQLHPIVEAMAGEAVADWAVVNEQEQKGKKGFYGYKPVFTLAWTTVLGREGVTLTCVKLGQPEAVHYANLARLAVPVCTLFGFIAQPENDKNESEALFMEYLEPVGLDENNPDHLSRFLSVKARLHAAQPSPEYREYLRAHDITRLGDDATAEDFAVRIRTLWASVWEHAGSGRLGAEFAALQQEQPDAPELAGQIARDVYSEVAQMPLCLTCSELAPGWRRGTDEMVCFDLHTTSIAPRFWDLAHIFGTPEGVHDGWQTTWPNRDALAAHYAGEWGRQTGNTLSTAELFARTQTLWVRHALDQGWWLSRSLSGEDGCRDDMLSVAKYFLAL